MFDEYPVYCDDAQAGTVRLKKLGLYICFDGLLELPYKSLWRVVCFCDHQRVDLGICLFDGTKYIIRKQLPEKYLNGESLRFEAINADSKPLTPSRPSENDSAGRELPAAEDSVSFCGGDHIF